MDNVGPGGQCTPYLGQELGIRSKGGPAVVAGEIQQAKLGWFDHAPYGVQGTTNLKLRVVFQDQHVLVVPLYTETHDGLVTEETTE